MSGRLNDSPRGRFLDGLASQVGLDRVRLEQPGVRVIGRADRAGSGALACYRVGPGLLVWADPAVVDGVADLADREPAPARSALSERLTASGFGLLDSVVMRVLPGDPVIPPAPAGSYRHRPLQAGDAAHVEAVRSFTARSDPADVEAADLENLDRFAEAAIHVLVHPDPGGVSAGEIVAYASASKWSWDPVFADIGVLVDRRHRGRGLGRYVVSETVRELLTAGRLPLYRHSESNSGSARLAAGLGMEPVAVLDYFTPAAPES